MRPVRIHCLVLPAVNLLDLAGPVQVLHTAAHHGGRYEIGFVAARPAEPSAQGLAFGSLAPLPPVAPGDVVLIPGPDLTQRLEIDAPTLDWVRSAAGAGASFVSICTGAIVLGDAGLLDGRRCTSHWSVIEAMRLRYPAALVDDSVLYVRDGAVATSAGIASGIDLALALVEDDLGPAVAAAVARELVVHVRRNGSSAPQSPFLSRRDHLDPVVHRVQQLLADRFAEAHTLPSLARAAHVSVRALTAAFTAATGVTPLQYQQELRIGHAGNLLTATGRPIDDIARDCGYADARHFRRLFTERHGVSPRAFRAAHR
ncbi:GlxA family transcriptional regulator [Actinoplanes couchii]|uniref:Transcriptional regulator n=1 Tax=Actinoplanes couchii TaxID=403638 RepID=A0ABQ3X4U6_9ACTN|nr:helix-turn-helix domain-containing protein [Actinoplanes couchii]MDR6326098.1 transcriptional regulator GlxA family with amidase domain [Actinoplanes couchii]GID53548.1 transcriptional regulator [Actinoplanes couchii]